TLPECFARALRQNRQCLAGKRTSLSKILGPRPPLRDGACAAAKLSGKRRELICVPSPLRKADVPPDREFPEPCRTYVGCSNRRPAKVRRRNAPQPVHIGQEDGGGGPWGG